MFYALISSGLLSYISKEVLTFSSVLQTFLKLDLLIHRKKKHRKNTYFTSFQIATAVVDVVISSSYSSYETIIWCEVVYSLKSSF